MAVDFLLPDFVVFWIQVGVKVCLDVGSSNRRVGQLAVKIENDFNTSVDFMDRQGCVLRRVTLADATAVTQHATPGAYLNLSRYLK